ncbi:insecticidal delta-endotoxin Cry8Ea1 family protein [Bacillus cereus group sp. IBL03679]|uniref:insecticidal delta-endotoxin Cry8Ea1 family protein n=1 Tax=Bacillus cereus group sp. IBL03679 TaxID=3240095 RepID=UPI003D2F6F16
MNQNYYNNEYEFMNSGDVYQQPRYPYAQAPGSEVQNMNYKDWMDRCARGESGDVFSTAALKGAIVTSSGIAWALLGLIPGAGPILSAVAGVINVAVPYIWPDQESDTPPSQATQYKWSELMNAAQELTDTAIETEVKNRVLQELVGLQRTTKLYQDAACDWSQSPDDPELKETVRTQFLASNTIYYDRMPIFQQQGFQAELLSSFTEAANLHLLLLRDAVKYGLAWGLDQVTVNRYYRYLKENTASYTAYCISTFNNELARLSTGTQGAASWNNYNKYRTGMTIMSLDIVALWPTFDPILYPLPVYSQLTREVYTQACGRLDDSPSMQTIESGLVRPPHLFTWLRSFIFGVDTTSDSRSTFLTRYKLGFSYISSKGFINGEPGEAELMETSWIGPRPGNTTNQGTPDWANIYNTHVNPGFTNNSFSPENLNTLTFRGRHEVSHLGFYSLIGGQSEYGGRYTSQVGFPCINPTQCDTSRSCLDTCKPSSTPNIGSVCEDVILYSERLSWLAAFRSERLFGTNALDTIIYAWTHASAKAYNIIDKNYVSQIPVVKASGGSGYSVIKGPGSTGGDLVSLAPNARIEVPLSPQFEMFPIETKPCRMRMRYACKLQTRVKIGIFRNDEWVVQEEDIVVPSTPYSGEQAALTYNAFGYVNLTSFNLTFPSNELIYIERIDSNDADPLIIDKIEFIPIEGSVEVFEAKEDLAKAWKAVNALFTNDGKHTLQLNITDYQIDQAARLVEYMSDKMYPKEKMCLLDHVKCAKQLSRARNLLYYGDFESSDWSGENGWNTSTHVSVASDNPIFKGRCLKLPGANQPQFSDQIFPTYAYQKIDESRLKPYTRYRVRGSIGNSKGLEVFATRYEKEVHKHMNVPNDIKPTNPCTGEYPLEQGSYPVVINQVIPQNMSCGPCEDGSQMMMQQTSMVCADPHEWECHIDTGELDINQNLGIWVGFKIGTTDGLATLDNIEVIEEGPLTGEALTRMKKREYKWKQKWNEKYMKIEKAVQVAQRAIQGLFTHADQSQLQASVTLQHIIDAEKWVQNIPYVYHPFLVGALPTVPGEAYDIFQQLSGAVAKARVLYEQRNVLRNGDFNAGLSNWQGTEGTQVQQIGNTSVLVISDWSTNVSQQVCVHPEHGYVLRVTAKKEGSGEGYVKISDGTEENTETLKFIAGESATSLVPPMTPSRESYYEQDMTNYPAEPRGQQTYATGNPMNYQSESFGINPYGDEDMMNDPAPYAGTDCGCGCSKKESMSYPPNNYEMNAYAGNTSGANPTGSSCGCGCHRKVYTSEDNMTTYVSESLSGYITKTVEIFPETNRVCIEIGETAGTFLVESIELIRMGCE